MNNARLSKMVIACLFLALNSRIFAADWNSPGNGNPIIGGYLADPSLFYDADSDLFYVYATSDGMDMFHQREPHVCFTKDFVYWDKRQLVLPSFWPMPTATQGIDGALWAPSIMKHPKNGKYYLLYSITGCTYIAFSDSPLGPWTNATGGTTAATAPLIKVGDMWGTGDAFDGQFFMDTDSTVYLTFGGNGNCGICRLTVSPDFRISIDTTDPRMTDAGTAGKRFKRISTPGWGYNEGTCLFKRNGTYFLTFSNNGAQNYNVRYAVGQTPVGPFSYKNRIILQRDNAQNILGPGHASVVNYKNSWYIMYHRQLFPFVDSKRLPCINKLSFGGTNGEDISVFIQDHAGVRSGTGDIEALVAASLQGWKQRNCALGKEVVASGEGDYKACTWTGEVFTPVSKAYKASYAVDDNLGTRWTAHTEQTVPSWLIVDLGYDVAVSRIETVFEYVFRNHNYRIDYLKANEAANLSAAQASKEWRLYADRTANGAIIPTAAQSARSWKYSTVQQSGNWYAPQFDDSSWRLGENGFGTTGTPNAIIRTAWSTPDIYLRTTFNPGAIGALQIDKLAFSVHHDEDVAIYINGVLSAQATGFTSGYETLPCNAAGKNAIIPNGSNTLAVHCHQTTGGQYIDVGLGYDLSGSIANESPFVDTGTVAARYFKITVVSANLPLLSELSYVADCDYPNRISIWEFRVIKADAVNVASITAAKHSDNTVSLRYTKNGIILVDVLDVSPEAGQAAPGSRRLKIDLFTVAGRKVATIVDRKVTAGRHQIAIQRSTVSIPQGYYLARISYGVKVKTAGIFITQ